MVVPVNRRRRIETFFFFCSAEKTYVCIVNHMNTLCDLFSRSKREDERFNSPVMINASAYNVLRVNTEKLQDLFNAAFNR